jgi:hypothetical protein
LWDGYLTAGGVNPYMFSPLEILRESGINITGININLFEKFGKDTFSSYPPLNQWIFALSVLISPDSLLGSILVIRIILLLFDISNIIIIRKILKKHNIPDRAGLLYALNPLVVLELTGNLHFEALMIFFLLLGFYLLKDHRWIGGSISMAMAVLSKLIPLIYLPLIWRRLGLKQGFFFIILTMLIVSVAFLPFLNLEMITGMVDSLGLYFQKFEFNASIYYLVRQAGYWLVGYNIIQVAGPVMGFLTLVMIVIYSLSQYAKNASLMESAMWISMIYFAMSTTLHPWYITTLIAFSVFTPYRFPVLWSLLIFLSYEGYEVEGYRENYGLITLEYVFIYGWMIGEIINNRKQKRPAG